MTLEPTSNRRGFLKTLATTIPVLSQLGSNHDIAAMSPRNNRPKAERLSATAQVVRVPQKDDPQLLDLHLAIDKCSERNNFTEVKRLVSEVPIDLALQEDDDCPESAHSALMMLATAEHHQWLTTTQAIELAQILINRGANANQKTAFGRTAMHNVGNDSAEFIKFLIANGAETKPLLHYESTQKSYTPLALLQDCYRAQGEINPEVLNLLS